MHINEELIEKAVNEIQSLLFFFLVNIRGEDPKTNIQSLLCKTGENRKPLQLTNSLMLL